MDAIVLSGGASYGAYEVGVLKSLSEKTGFNPEIITGTSVGGYNAAILATESIKRLEEIWLKVIPESPLGGNGVLRVRGNPFPYLNPLQPSRLVSSFIGDSIFLTQTGIKRGEAFLTSRGSAASRFSELVDVSAFISCEPLKLTIRKTVSLSGIRQSRKQLRIMATDWEAGTARRFCNEDMTDVDGENIILASTAIPGIFPPVTFQDRTYVDGGVVMNTPLKPAIQAGADTIHVISLDPVIRRVSSTEFDNTLEATLRLLQIAIGSAVREDIATAEWINAGLDALERARSGKELGVTGLRDVIRAADVIDRSAAKGVMLKKITVHHYQPSTSLGSPLSLLDFSRKNIENLIGRGYEDATRHICASSGCIFGTVTTREPPAVSAVA